MRRLGPKQRWYHPRLSRRRYLRRLRSKRLAVARRGGFVKVKLRGARIPPITIHAPRAISVTGGKKARSETLDFIRRVRTECGRSRAVMIDFDQTEQVVSCGTILLMAELDRLRLLGVGKRMRGKRPKTTVVRQVFDQVGLSELLRIRRQTWAEDSLPESVKHWRFRSGTLAEGEELAELHGDFKSRIPQFKRLYAGVVEAMANTKAHAYPHQASDADTARWWMFWQVRDNTLSVSIIDLGIGIPKSLSESKRWAKDAVEKVLLTLSQAHPVAARILAAIELGRTRTELPHRGKGLADVMEVIQMSPGAQLRIASDRGLVQVGKEDAPETRDYSTCLDGTLIQWTIPLSSEAAS